MKEARRSAFEREALSHLHELYAAALHYSRNKGDADDLVQETLVRAFAAWDHFRAGTNCRAWLLRILTNSFITEYRRATRERQWLGRGEPIVCPARYRRAIDPEGTIVEQSLSDEVVKALRDLPPEFQRVVVMADIEGLTYHEVARRLGCPPGTVMSRLFRARRQLAATLGEFARKQGITRTSPTAAAA